MDSFTQYPTRTRDEKREEARDKREREMQRSRARRAKRAEHIAAERSLALSFGIGVNQ